MFEEKDKAFFENALERMEDIAESIGIKINRKSRVALKVMSIFLALATIGTLFFVWTLIKRSIIKKK
jgi:hypothetical protein